MLGIYRGLGRSLMGRVGEGIYPLKGLCRNCYVMGTHSPLSTSRVGVASVMTATLLSKQSLPDRAA